MLTKKIVLFGLTLGLWVAACSPLAVPAADPDAPKAAPDTEAPAAAPSPVSEGDAANAAVDAYAPQAGDAALTRGPAFVDEQTLVVRESAPPQYSLELVGSLPSPCHQLRVAVGQPQADGTLKIEVYTVVDPNQMCAQVLKDFKASVPLSPPPAGQTYTVLVNDAPAGELKP